MAARLIDRKHALAFRQRATHLHARLPPERLIEAAFAGLQDSAPRSAVLALHARVEKVSPSAWRDPRFVQVWGPRGAVYVVPRDDVGVFTLGRLPRDPTIRAAVEAAADRIRKAFRNRKTGLAQGPSMQRLGLSLHDLRIASISGVVRIEWDGSKTTWWVAERPTDEPEFARLELVRRFLHSVGPSTPEEFARWSGGAPSDARDTFRSLEKELAEVELEGRKSWVLQSDLDALEWATPVATVRLLPPGDPYLATADRKMLVPISRFRSELWPKSVWPGALMVKGELEGTWRRQIGRVVVRTWRRLRPETKAAVESEVVAIPIESAKKEVRWRLADVR